MHKRTFIIFFLLSIIKLLNCDTHNDANEAKCCNNATNQQIVVEFTSAVVEHEYIVHFKNYYKQETRSNYIKKALENSEVNYGCIWVKITINCIIFTFIWLFPCPSHRSETLRYYQDIIQQLTIPATLMSYVFMRISN